jgi:hypothetical protein
MPRTHTSVNWPFSDPPVSPSQDPETLTTIIQHLKPIWREQLFRRLEELFCLSCGEELTINGECHRCQSCLTTAS